MMPYPSDMDESGVDKVADRGDSDKDLPTYCSKICDAESLSRLMEPPGSSDRPEAGITFHREHGYLRDRKSTRLNSSHVSISYAVFCLKKKKETVQRQQH